MTDGMLTPVEDVTLVLFGDNSATRLRPGVDHVRMSLVPAQHRHKFTVAPEGPGRARRSVETRAGTAADTCSATSRR